MFCHLVTIPPANMTIAKMSHAKITLAKTTPAKVTLPKLPILKTSTVYRTVSLYLTLKI